MLTLKVADTPYFIISLCSIPDDFTSQGQCFITNVNILNRFLLETSLKSVRLLDSWQVSSANGDHVDHVTLLFGGYLLVVLSFGVVASPDVVKWCEIVKNISGVPFLLPQQAIADVAVAKEMLFILYHHGMVSQQKGYWCHRS